MPNSTEIDKLFKQAKSYFRKEKFAEALLLYSQILKIDPQNVEACYHRSLTYFQLKNIAGALQGLSDVLAIDTNHVLARFKRLEYSFYLWETDFELLIESLPAYCKQFYNGDPFASDLPKDMSIFMRSLLEFIELRASRAELRRDYSEAIRFWQLYHDCGGKIDYTSEDVLNKIDWLKKQVSDRNG